jgi:hypothetical protein
VNHYRALSKLSDGFEEHGQYCCDDTCPLTIGENLLRVLDRHALTNEDLVGVVTAVLFEYQLRLASPAQRVELATHIVILGAKLRQLSDDDLVRGLLHPYVAVQPQKE